MAKLSKREKAVKASKKVATAPKSAVRSVAAKPAPKLADISGEGRMTNAQYESNIASGLGNKASVTAAKEASKLSSSPAKQREAAAKVYKPPTQSAKPSSLLGGLFGTPTANAASEGPEGIDYNSVSLKPTTQRTGLARAGQILSDPLGIRSKLRGAGVDVPQNPDFGLTEALGLDKYLQEDTGLANYATDQGQVLGVNDQQSMADFAQLRETSPTADANEFMRSRGRQTAGDYSPFASNSYQGSRNVNAGVEEKGRDEAWVNPWGDVDISGEGNVGFDASGLGGGTPVSDPFQGVQPTNASVRTAFGGGAFGNGMGVGNPAQQDPYMEEMRKSLKGYGRQEKDVMKQFEDMIRALDPTYNEYQRQGEEALNRNLLSQNTQLASVMNANNTGDSEQRAQLMAGQQRDTQTQLADLVRKLMLEKQSEISGYRSKSVDAVNSIRDKRMTAQQALAQMMRDAENTQWDRQYKMASLNKTGGSGSNPLAGSLTYLGNDSTGSPVYQNTKTGQRVNGTGLTRKSSNPFEEQLALLLSGNNNSQGQVQYDENGRAYIEQ